MILDAPSLLRWYDRHRRDLPWRAKNGQDADPYHVWLSEIMLQQTTVQTVRPYYERFLKRFPHIHDLAQAPQADVLQLWAGLGYYARARNLHACAQHIAEQGTFPRDLDSLLKLPGIGAYTARAIASIAFNQPVVPVDGNVERITARLFNIEDPLPTSRPLLARHASTLNAHLDAQKRPSDFAQALFDLGATLCTPRNPSCLTCPLQKNCQGLEAGQADTLPRRLPKKPRPNRYGVYFRLIKPDGAILLRQRPSHGLLGGTNELPGTPWEDQPWDFHDALTFAPYKGPWRHRGQIKHIFSHFTLYLNVYEYLLSDNELQHDIKPSFGKFLFLNESILSGAMKKCILIGKTDPVL
ncbi:A/G-specific adenine glycosylase [Saccharibacter sp. 17.LH.SD]|uniref:A/G-specific adenine glycosylase n=1 Tax=Saccharibacter sp. 17.LH.SD TaxID=2689393 RepID=UPI001371F9BF|nr:A/G-specific adenine glycosylase [Saccharibacter sp. 17.LH.SD]